MDIAYVGYLLFVIPGFCLVWSFRHFTRAQKLGDFEYAAWSLIWGIIPLALFAITLKINSILGISVSTSQTIHLNNPFELLGGLIGMSLALVTMLSFPLGYIGAFFSRKGWLSRLDSKLFKMIEK